MGPVVYPVCVIGGGSAGIMAVLRTVLNNDDCLFLPGTAKDKKKSRALWVRKVENMPAHLKYKRGIEEPNAETLKWIQESAFNERLHLLKNTGAASLKKIDDHFEVTDSKGVVHLAKFVILCTGVMDVQPVIKGSIETVFDYANAQTIDYCLICDGHHVLGKKTGVIGSSISAAWVSIMLYERYQPTSLTILTNGETPSFDEDIKKILQAYAITVNTSPIKEILGDEKGKVLRGFELVDGEVVETDITFVSLGMLVYNELALQVGAEVDARGFVKTDETGHTNVNGLYVAGDLKANSKKQIYTAWDEAVNSANAINQKIRQERRSKLLNS
jgi:thioredoxin reductase (NADPH)